MALKISLTPLVSDEEMINLELVPLDYARLGTAAYEEFIREEARIDAGLCLIFDLTGGAQGEFEAQKREVGQAVVFEGAWRNEVIEAVFDQQQFLMEIFLGKYVDNYLNYLSGLLFEIFTQRPETLKTGEKIEVAQVLSHKTMKELIRGIAETKVQVLSYKSFRDLSSFFRDSLGLDLGTPEEIGKIVEAIETRNISVHNRCVINERYVSRTGAEKAKIGTVRQITLVDVSSMSKDLSSAARNADRVARTHLRLKAKRFRIDIPERLEERPRMKEEVRCNDFEA